MKGRDGRRFRRKNGDHLLPAEEFLQFIPELRVAVEPAVRATGLATVLRLQDLNEDRTQARLVLRHVGVRFEHGHSRVFSSDRRVQVRA